MGTLVEKKREDLRKYNGGVLESQKKKRAIALFKANLTAEKPLTIQEILLRAGYSEETARQQTNILFGIRNEPEVKTLVQRMERIRDRLLDEIDRRIGDDKKVAILELGELRIGFGDFLKHIELLGGRPTDRVGVQIDEEHRKKLREILADNT